MNDALEGKIIEEKIKRVLTTPLKELLKRKKRIDYFCAECHKGIESYAFTCKTLELLRRYYDTEGCAEKGKKDYITEMDPEKIIGEEFLRNYARNAIKRIESEEIIKYSVEKLI